MIRITVAIAIASVLIASSVAAQSESVTSALCWTAKPVPACGAWIVSEFGVEKGVAGTHRARGEMDFSHAFSITLGRMKNTSPTEARGFTGAITLTGNGPGFRVEARRRTWNSTTSAMDWSAGLSAQPTMPATSDFGFGLTGGGAINYRWLGLTARADLVQGGRGTAAGLLVGGRIGEKAGTVGAGLFTAGIVTLIILIAGSGADLTY